MHSMAVLVRTEISQLTLRLLNKSTLQKNFKTLLYVEIELLGGVIQLALVLVLLVPAGEPPAVQGVVGHRGHGAAQVILGPGLVQVGQVQGGHVGEGGVGGGVVEPDHGLVFLHAAPGGPGGGAGEAGGGGHLTPGAARSGLGHLALGVWRDKS